MTYLGQDTELYGRQRMFGSLGWGLAIFIVATILGKKKKEELWKHSFLERVFLSLCSIRSIEIAYILCLRNQWTT